MNKASLLIMVVLLAVFTACAAAQELGAEQPAAADKINIKTIGAPDVSDTGSYNLNTGELTTDVSGYEGAYIQITYKDMVVTGRTVVYRQKDGYLLVTGDVRVEQKDLVLTCDKLEYYTNSEKMLASGSLQVTTDDAVASADELIYLKKEERIDFISNVVMNSKDPEVTFHGQHMILWRETNQIKFNGPYHIDVTLDESEEPAAE